MTTQTKHGRVACVQPVPCASTRTRHTLGRQPWELLHSILNTCICMSLFKSYYRNTWPGGLCRQRVNYQCNNSFMPQKLMTEASTWTSAMLLYLTTPWTWVVFTITLANNTSGIIRHKTCYYQILFLPNRQHFFTITLYRILLYNSRKMSF
jgi:hypothetical protein